MSLRIIQAYLRSVSMPGSLPCNQDTHIGLTFSVIDEYSSPNPLSDRTRPTGLISSLSGSEYSGNDGFAENTDKQTELALFLIRELGLERKGPFLDVGFGTNVHIANAFAGAGITSYVVDRIDHSRNLQSPGNPLKTKAKGVSVLVGDATEVDKLCRHKFGTILFNGSWIAGGNNWTVNLIGESKYHGQLQEARGISRTQLPVSIITNKAEFIDKEKDSILSSCGRALAANGILGIVSSRYSHHGAGFTYSQLPEEKLYFIDLFERFTRLGAKRIYLFGLSQNGFDEFLSLSRKASQDYIDAQPPLSGKAIVFAPQMLREEEIQKVRDQLRSVSNLPPEDICSRYASSEEERDYQVRRNKSNLEAAASIKELNNIARIDAMFAEF